MQDDIELTGVSRRSVLRLGTAAGALLAAGLWPGRLRAGDEPATGDFTFLCVNDLHYFDRNCDPFFQRMVRQMNATGEKAAAGAGDAAGDAATAGKDAGDADWGKPEFCLIVGDLAEDGTAAQLGAIRDHLKGLSVPTSVVVGNHDYLEQNDRRPFEELFPKQINYAFEHRGWQFVALDTTQGRTGSGTSVHRDTLGWLNDYAARLDRRRPTILFTHFPLGWLVPSRPKNADDVLLPFKDLNLRAVFNGHFHGYTSRSRWNASITTDKCCSFHHANHDGTKEKGYFLCRAKAGAVERKFVEVKTT